MKARLFIRPWKGGYESLGDEGWTLTEDEDENNDDQHASDLVLGATVLRVFVVAVVSPARRAPRVALLASVAKCCHQLVVEYDEGDQWNEEHDQKIHHR